MVKLKLDGTEKRSGGKRSGSGRPKRGINKIQCNFYTSKCNILLLGGKKNIRKLCLKMIEDEVAIKKRL